MYRESSIGSTFMEDFEKKFAENFWKDPKTESKKIKKFAMISMLRVNCDKTLFICWLLYQGILVFPCQRLYIIVNII